MKEKSRAYKIFTVCNYIFMLFIIVITVFPYLHELAKALNEGSDTMLGGLTLIPRKFTFENFQLLLSDTSIYKSFVITIARVLLGTALGLAAQFCAAYSLSKNHLKGRAAILIFLTIPMFFNGGVIPNYLLYSNLGLINNFAVYIFPFIYNFFNILVIRTYLATTIPDSLEEAARIDGAGTFSILVRMILPLSKPILATIALWIAVFHWNDWTTTLTYVTQERLYTAQYKLMQLIKESERLQQLMSEAAMSGQSSNVAIKSTPEALISAQVIITTIPIILVYPFLQKYFVQGVMIGSLKG